MHKNNRISLFIAFAIPWCVQAMRSLPITSNRTSIVTSDGVAHTIPTDHLRSCNVFTNGLLEGADLQHQPREIPLPEVTDQAWYTFDECRELEHTARTSLKRERQKEAQTTLAKKLKKKKTVHQLITVANYLDHPQLFDIGTTRWSRARFIAQGECTLPRDIEREIALKIMQSTTLDAQLPKWIAKYTWLETHKHTVSDILWSCCTNSTGTLKVVGDTKGVVTVLPDWAEPSHSFQAHTREVSDLQFSPDNKLLVSVARDGTIKLWDATNNFDLTHTFTTPYRVPFVARFSPDSTLLATDNRRNIDLWHVATGTKQTVSLPEASKIDTLAFSHSGLLLATGDYQGSVTLWNITEQTCIKISRLHSFGKITSVAFNHDDTMLAIGDYYGFVHTYDMKTTAGNVYLRMHDDAIRGLAFTPDGRFLCSGSADKKIHIHDVATRRSIKTLSLASDVNDLRLTADNTLMAACGDGNLYQWPLHRFLNRYYQEKETLERQMTIPQAKLLKQLLAAKSNRPVDATRPKHKKAFLAFSAVMRHILSEETAVIAPKQ